MIGMGNEAIEERVGRIDWDRIHAMIEERGYATTAALLTAEECAELIGLYETRERFRSRVDMARLRFGVGEYKYFSNPLPAIVEQLREALYPRVAPIANAWMEALRIEDRFPPKLDEFIARCHREGQLRPTPLMLRYDAGGYNCLHQDLYGEVVFPLQFTIMLSRLGRPLRESSRPAPSLLSPPGQGEKIAAGSQHSVSDFDGGEFLLVEQRPRAQSRGAAITLQQGEAILFATRYRPVRGARGSYRASVRHGVSTIDRGRRFTLGIIFHDAK